MTGSPLIWVHLDALSLSHPVFQAAPPHAEAVYIWDENDVARRGWSLKRCVFVLDCLAAMDVPVVAGQAEAVLSGHTVYVANSVDPQIRQIVVSLGDAVTVVRERAFATLPDDTDMGRFFRFWNTVRRSAMRPPDLDTKNQI